MNNPVNLQKQVPALLPQQQQTVGFMLKRVDCNDGVASHCETLIRGLKERGWRVVLFSGPISYDSTSISRFEGLRELVDEWVIFERMNPLLPSPACLARIRKAVIGHRISVFHAHGYSMLLIAKILYLVTNTKCVATFHPSIHGSDPTSLHEKASASRNQKYRLFLRFFSPAMFIAYSAEIARFLIHEIGFRESRVCRTLLGIDTNFFREPSVDERKQARQRLNLEDRELVCALVGRMSWNKGHDVLIDAVRKLRERKSTQQITCLFSGSGYEEEKIKAYALKDENDRLSFRFLGYTANLRDVYWATDVFVLPSRKEGFALVVAEAMACGVIPIRTPSGGAEDQIVDGVNGFIIPFDDADALVSKLRLLLDSPSLIRNLTAEALKTAHEKFTVARMIDDTIATYDKTRTLNR